MTTLTPRTKTERIDSCKVDYRLKDFGALEDPHGAMFSGEEINCFYVPQKRTDNKLVYSDQSFTYTLNNNGDGRAVIAADINNDGLEDLILRNLQDPKLEIYLQRAVEDLKSSLNLAITAPTISQARSTNLSKPASGSVSVATKPESNNSHEKNHWLQLQFRAPLPSLSPPKGRKKGNNSKKGRGRSGFTVPLGTVARIIHPFLSEAKILTAGSGHFSQKPLLLHFGTGHFKNYAVEVRWPSGLSEVFKNLSSNRRYLITKGVKKAESLTIKSVSSSVPFKTLGKEWGRQDNRFSRITNKSNTYGNNSHSDSLIALFCSPHNPPDLYRDFLKKIKGTPLEDSIVFMDQGKRTLSSLRPVKSRSPLTLQDSKNSSADGEQSDGHEPHSQHHKHKKYRDSYIQSEVLDRLKASFLFGKSSNCGKSALHFFHREKGYLHHMELPLTEGQLRALIYLYN